MELNKDNMKKIFSLIAFTVVIFVCFQNINVVIDTIKGLFGLLSPFILGGCIAFILNVPMRLFERILFKGDRFKKIKRPVSILLTLVFVIGIIFIVAFIIVPELVNTIGILAKSIPDFVIKVENFITDLAVKYPELQDYVKEIEIDWNAIGANALGYVQNITSGLFSSTIGVVGSIVSGLMNFIIGFVFAIYILAKKESLSRQGKKLLYSFLPEERADKTVSVFSLAENTFANFLSGQCTEAIILGCMFFIAMTIFNFPYALLVGVLIAFTALIPIFGAFIGCVIGAFLILMINPVQAFWFIILFNVLQQIEGNLIYPQVVGGSVGLPSIWVLFAVTVGGNLMGIVGMLVFIPLCSVVYALLRSTVNKRLNKKGIGSEKLEPRPIPLELIKMDDKPEEYKKKLGKSIFETKIISKKGKEKRQPEKKETQKNINKQSNIAKNEKDKKNSDTGSFTKINK